MLTLFSVFNNISLQYQMWTIPNGRNGFDKRKGTWQWLPQILISLSSHASFPNPVVGEPDWLSSHVSRSFFSTSVTNNRYDLPMSVVNLASRSHNHPVQGTAIYVSVIEMIAGKYSYNWQNCSGFGCTYTMAWVKVCWFDLYQAKPTRLWLSDDQGSLSGNTICHGLPKKTHKGRYLLISLGMH